MLQDHNHVLGARFICRPRQSLPHQSRTACAALASKAMLVVLVHNVMLESIKTLDLVFASATLGSEARQEVLVQYVQLDFIKVFMDLVRVSPVYQERFQQQGLQAVQHAQQTHTDSGGLRVLIVQCKSYLLVWFRITRAVFKLPRQVLCPSYHAHVIVIMD